MNDKTVFAGSALTLATCAACAATPEIAAPSGELDSPTVGDCDAAAARGMIGQPANTTTGKRLLELTGARELRWAAPRSAITMDYRVDRITVEYDDAMKITRVACG